MDVKRVAVTGAKAGAVSAWPAGKRPRTLDVGDIVKKNAEREKTTKLPIPVYFLPNG